MSTKKSGKQSAMMQEREELMKQVDELRDRSIALEKKLLMLSKIAEKSRKNVQD